MCDTRLTEVPRRRRYIRVPEPRPDSPDYARWLRRTMTREDFEALPDDDIEALRRFAVVETYPPGTILFRQGDAPQAAFIVEEGEIELVYQTKYDRLIVEILSAGASIGDLAVMFETPYPYTGVVRTPTTALSFSADTIHTLIELYPEICFRWLVHLEAAGARISPGRRIGRQVGARADRALHLHEAEERRSMTIGIAQTDLAATLALSRQTVSRMLGQLEREGLIECRRGLIGIRDLQGLRKRLPR